MKKSGDRKETGGLIAIPKYSRVHPRLGRLLLNAEKLAIHKGGLQSMLSRMVSTMP